MKTKIELLSIILLSIFSMYLVFTLQSNLQNTLMVLLIVVIGMLLILYWELLIKSMGLIKHEY